MRLAKLNISAGLLFMAAFMLYGFVLIYLRDFAPGKEQWIAEYSVGKHFESRLAHVHGNLFAFMNIVIGYLLLREILPASGGPEVLVELLDAADAYRSARESVNLLLSDYLISIYDLGRATGALLEPTTTTDASSR